jgi:HEAT repeat protein
MSKSSYVVSFVIVVSAVFSVLLSVSVNSGTIQGLCSDQKSIDSLIAIVVGTNEDIQGQCDAALTLGACQDTSHIEVLLSSPLLKDKHNFLYILRALSNYDDDRARAAILPFLYSETGIYAGLAAKCYTKNVVPSMYQPLYERIVSAEEHNQASREAAIALSSANDSLSTALMIEALETKDSKSRMIIGQALGKRDPNVALDSLVGLLDDEIYGVRMVAANSLGELRDARATEFLAAKVLENDFGISGHAALAIAEIGDTTAIEPLVSSLSLNLDQSDLWGICEALRRLTGQDYEDEAELWISWYESLRDSSGSVR